MKSQLLIDQNDIEKIVKFADEKGVGKEMMRGLNVKDGRLALDITVEDSRVVKALTKTLKNAGYIVTSIKELDIIEVRKCG